MDRPIATAACIHEAGHALAAHLTGRLVTLVSIGANGCGTSEHEGSRPTLVPTASVLYLWAIATLAGEYAEWVNGFPMPKDLESPDRVRVDEIVRQLPGDPKATLRRLEDRTRAFVRQHNDAIRRFAGILDAHGGRLSGPEVGHALEASLANDHA